MDRKGLGPTGGIGDRCTLCAKEHNHPPIAKWHQKHEEYELGDIEECSECEVRAVMVDDVDRSLGNEWIGWDASGPQPVCNVCSDSKERDG
jgi:hypothetical protein